MERKEKEGCGLELFIPTYRPRRVLTTISDYEQHFVEYGHRVPIIIFDDSQGDQVVRYLEEKKGEKKAFSNPLYVVGQTEKRYFLNLLAERMASRPEERKVLERLLRPSFGGNRNHLILYSLGGRFIAVDDDIRPYGIAALDFNQQEQEGVVIKGNYDLWGATAYKRVEGDIAKAFGEVLGKRVGSLRGFEIGQNVHSPRVDLFRNKSQELAVTENIFYITSPSQDFSSAIVKVAETGLSGADDLDSLDFAYFFLKDSQTQELGEIRRVLILSTQRPFVTKNNWKNACGVSGYDNTNGLPSFFPTALRFEDYIYRLWLQKEGVASVHLGVVQYHERSLEERASLASDIVNEELANFLKDKLRLSLTEIGELSLRFGYEGEIKEEEVKNILELGRRVYGRAEEEIGRAEEGSRRKEQLGILIKGLESEFRSFESSSFREKMQEVIDSELGLILKSQEIWPRCVEAAGELKREGRLPLKKIN